MQNHLKKNRKESRLVDLTVARLCDLEVTAEVVLASRTEKLRLLSIVHGGREQGGQPWSKVTQQRTQGG